MAFVTCELFSQTMRQHLRLCLTLPDACPDPARPWQVLYLLHGGTDDATSWYRETDMEAVSNRWGLVTVSIDAMSSAYADMRHGLPYFTFLTQELPAFLAAHLPVSVLPEHSLIAGFSMGGQGALKAAFRCPDRYRACIALSGARDMIPLFEQWQAMENGPDLRGVEDALGPISELRGGENDIVWLAEQAAQKKMPLPALYLACGTEDYAVKLSDAYHEHLLSIGLEHWYYKAEGIHGYRFAGQALEAALEEIMQGRDAS